MDISKRDNKLIIELLTTEINLSQLSLNYGVTKVRISQIIKQYFRKARRNDPDGKNSLLWTKTFKLSDIYNHRTEIFVDLLNKKMLYVKEII